MKALTIFRILTFILIPIAALFGVMDFFMLFMALANPSMLFVVFVMAGFVIYSFASLYFLTRGIDINKPCKPSLKDWIKVNGYVAAFMGLTFLTNSIGIFLLSDADLKQFLGRFLESQPTVPPTFTTELFVQAMKMAAYFLLFVGILTLVHIPLNFRLLKKYGYLFNEQTAS